MIVVLRVEFVDEAHRSADWWAGFMAGALSQLPQGRTVRSLRVRAFPLNDDIRPLPGGLAP